MIHPRPLPCRVPFTRCLCLKDCSPSYRSSRARALTSSLASPYTSSRIHVAIVYVNVVPWYCVLCRVVSWRGAACSTARRGAGLLRDLNEARDPSLLSPWVKALFDYLPSEIQARAACTALRSDTATEGRGMLTS